MNHFKRYAGWMAGAGMILLAPTAGKAALLPELTQVMNEEIGAVSDAMDRCELSAPADALASTRAVQDGWYFKRFWFRVRPKVTIGIPSLAKVTLVPELELLWDRAFPDGWTGYKPPAL